MEEPGITAGPNVVGLDDGLPDVTLHPAMIGLELGLPARSHCSQGQHLGQPTRATVGLAIMGSGLDVVGLVALGPAVVGLELSHQKSTRSPPEVNVVLAPG